MKTPNQIAADIIVSEHRRDGESFPRDWDDVQALIVRAIEADRSQLVGELPAARHAIDLTHDAAEGDSNDSEIELLQAVRDNFQVIVEAVGGEWDHEPDTDHMDQEEWPHVTEEDDQ